MNVWFGRKSKISADSAISVVSTESTYLGTCCKNFECLSDIATFGLYWHQVTFMIKWENKNCGQATEFTFYKYLVSQEIPEAFNIFMSDLETMKIYFLKN